MKILILNHEYPPIGGGGGQACKNLAEELVKRGHEITILTTWFRGLPKNESFPGLNILRISSFRTSPFRAGFISMGLYIAASAIRGLLLINRWKPHLIHAHFAVPAGFSAYILNRLTGIPYFITAHLGDVPGGVPEKTDRWFRLVYPFTIPIWKNASEIIAVSDFTASLARKHYPVSPKVIHNGISLEDQNESLTLNKPPGILFAGRFVPQKNLFVFLEILNAIRDLSWTCIMIGDGPDFQPITQKAKEFELSDRIAFPGWVNQDSVKAFLKLSDILLMPSISEGLPVIGVEALAAGLAIMASNIGGFIDLVDNGENGFLAELNDLAVLKVKIRELLENPDKLLKARLKSLLISKKFNISSIATEYEAIFSGTVKL